MIKRGVLRCCVSLTILTLLTGCGLFNDDEPRIDRSSGPLSDERYQWTASPGIDLLTGPAVPIRAYIESWLDAQTMGSLDYAYPGFDRTVAARPTDGRLDMLTGNLRPDEDGSPSETVRVGNNRFRIQSISRSGQKVTAILCHYRYRLALEEENGKFVSVAHNAVHDDGIEAMLVMLNVPVNEQSNLPPQAGPAPAPVVDVFGDWKITGFLNGFRSPDPEFDNIWPTFDEDTAKCVAEAPDPPERRAFLIQGEHPRSDFPNSPPSPGWPEGGSE